MAAPKLKRVRFKHALAGSPHSYRANQVVDLSSRQAKAFIKGGHCELLPTADEAALLLKEARKATQTLAEQSQTQIRDLEDQLALAKKQVAELEAAAKQGAGKD